MRSQIEWHSWGHEVNPWKRWHPFRSLVQWYNGRIMDRFIDQELDKRFDELSRRPYNVEDEHNPAFRPSKSVVSLAMEHYVVETEKGKQLDSTFRSYARAQVRLFLFGATILRVVPFAGASICYPTPKGNGNASERARLCLWY